MAITTNQSVLTLDYWKRAEHLEIGDWVFSKDGELVQIKLVHKFFSEICYEVMFDDYLSVSGTKDLGFIAESMHYRNHLCAYKQVKKKFKTPLTFTNVEKLLQVGLTGHRGRKEFSVPTTKPLQFPMQTQGVPPFIFGFWYFNRKAHKMFTVCPTSEELVFSKFKDLGYKVTKTKNSNAFYETPNIEQQLLPLRPTKIPMNYLLAGVEERIALLSGIVNGKPRQYDPKTDWFRVTNHNFAMIQQIQGLAESIGCRTKIKHDATYDYYQLMFKTSHRLVSNQVSKPFKVQHARRYIKAITQIQPQMCIHIETDGEDNSLLVGEGFIATC